MIDCHGSENLSYDEPNSKSQAPQTTIDWSLAEPLSTAGTTCDTFRYTYNLRVIFLKRLKKEYEYNYRYRDSIRKEYELGRKLEHPALPNYEAEHGDTWLVTRYVDGRTLAELLSEKSPWLAKTENVRRMLAELVDVVAYLHNHRVTHCDIHAGNVMLDHYNKLRLIDLGHCYTDWAPKSSGKPSNLGGEQLAEGSPLIDFRMIGQLTRQILSAYPSIKDARLKDFITACLRTDVSDEMLIDILNRTDASSKKWWIAGAVLVAIIIAATVLLFPKAESESQSPVVTNNNTAVVGHTIDTLIITQKENPPTPEVENTPKPMDMSVVMAEINAEVSRYFRPLYADIRRIEELAMSDTTDYRTLLRESTEYVDRAEQIQQAAQSHLQQRFPGITPNVISTSEAWLDYNAADHRMSELVSGEIRRRAQAQVRR